MPLTHNHDGVHVLYTRVTWMWWCAGMTGLCGAVARNEHEQWTHTHTHNGGTNASNCRNACRAIFTIIIIYSRFLAWFCFSLAFGRETASRSHNSKHPLGPKDDGQRSKNSCRWLLAIPFHLNFRLLFFFSLSLPYSIIISNTDNIPIPWDKEREIDRSIGRGGCSHWCSENINKAAHPLETGGHFSRRVTVFSLVKK